MHVMHSRCYSRISRRRLTKQPNIGTRRPRQGREVVAKADAEGDLQDTITTLDADQNYLDDLMATCEQKAADFESQQ